MILSLVYSLSQLIWAPPSLRLRRDEGRPSSGLPSGRYLLAHPGSQVLRPSLAAPSVRAAGARRGHSSHPAVFLRRRRRLLFKLDSDTPSKVLLPCARRFPNVCRSVVIAAALVLVSAVPSPAQILVLAPEEESFVPVEDFFGCFSLAGADLDVRRVKMYFDRDDVSTHVRLTSSTATFVPTKNFLNRPDIAGPHTLTLILYGPYRAKLDEVSVRFYLTSTEELSDSDMRAMVEKGRDVEGARPLEFVNTGTIYTAAQYQSYRDSGDFMAELDASANGYRGNWFYNSYLYLNTEENSHEQTLQRFMISSGYTKNYQVSFGDLWPSYNAFVLRDQRVRGIEVNLKSPKRMVNLDVAYGLAKRAVSPYLYDKAALRDEIAGWDTTGGRVFGHNDSAAFFENGTYRRRLLASRLHFGTGRIAQVGLDFLKAVDDTCRYARSTRSTRSTTACARRCAARPHRTKSPRGSTRACSCGNESSRSIPTMRSVSSPRTPLAAP